MGVMFDLPETATLFGMGRSPIANFQGLVMTDWKSWNRTLELQIPRNGGTGSLGFPDFGVQNVRGSGFSSRIGVLFLGLEP